MPPEPPPRRSAAAAPPLTAAGATPQGLWFGGNAEVDADITAKFGADCEALLRHEYDAWQTGDDPAEALAAIILGDQLTRNVYRGTAKMYAADPLVLPWSKALVVRAAARCTFGSAPSCVLAMPTRAALRPDACVRCGSARRPAVGTGS